ncbi:LLM class flavin-dependent oxidoreductase, partial [Pseudonocardia pini]|uniref:LLM class flavin-dependent oxidoreductase n=1 Tax=Pseudonocardia pini TaxID=2758030 RepID=UPI0015F08BD5
RGRGCGGSRAAPREPAAEPRRDLGGEHLQPAQRLVEGGALTLLAALSQVTERIGLVATAATTHHEPFHLARKLASLDHLSAGRAGWNVVTSPVPLEAAHLGREGHLEDGARYARAAESVDVVRSLWDSLADGAVLRDKATGRYYDPAGLRLTAHSGEHFEVRGPLNISRPPQGHPVLVHADPSEAGRDFAARYADVVVTEQPDAAAGKSFVDDLHGRVRAHGRDPGRVRVWTSVHAGAPAGLADRFEEWFHAGAADGFLVSFPAHPGAVAAFVEHVVSELRRRGMVRADGDAPATLRDHLGLERP